MGFLNREIEQKLVIVGAKSIRDVDKYLLPYLESKCRKLISGSGEDIYFKSPRKAKADFVRLRRADRHDTAKLTIKFTDRGSVEDRVEKDLDVGDAKQAKSMLIDLFGKPSGSIFKSYVVYVMGKALHEASSTISVCQIRGDSRVYIEVEATSASKVKFWRKRLEKVLPYQFRLEKRSFFKIFIK
jgi:hypothetical protein